MFDLERSPIRKNIKKLSDEQLSIFEDDLFVNGDSSNARRFQVRTVLKDVENMLVTMENNKDNQLRIAIMGEVKAGKSTLINACVGKRVAYTDILEATAIVSEISFSNNEYARVLDKQGQAVLNYSFEELIEWTEEKIDNMEDFSEYGKIELGVNNELLESLILLDTPGLLSITSENHDVTAEYIAQTDYILWVLNSRTLGSNDVNEFVKKIKLTGKPLIGAINKVDSDEERAEIREFVEKEYHNVFSEIFYLSAENAWNALVDGDKIGVKKSGIQEILMFLEDVSENKEFSSKRTQFHQLQREREVHMKMHATIDARKNYYDNELATFAQINNEMKKVISAELNSWLDTELYMDQRAKLMNAKENEFKELFETYSTPRYLTDIIEKKYQEMSNFVFKKWDIIEESLNLKSTKVLFDFNYDKNIESDISDNSSVDENVLLVDGAKKGLKNGTIVGLAFAGYSAWLGPAAATVTFAGAIVPIVPVLALGGLVFGSWLEKNSINTVDLEKNAKIKQKYVEDLYQEVIKATEKEIKEIEKRLFACTDQNYARRCDSYNEKVQTLYFDFTEPEYGKFMTEFDTYIKDLHDAINEVANEPIVEPPQIEGLLDD